MDGYISIYSYTHSDSITSSDSFARVVYSWSTGDTGAVLSGITAGTYMVTATDGYGCSVSDTIVVAAGYVSLPHPAISYPFTTCDSINTFVITANFDTSKYQYWWEASNTVQQRDTILNSNFVLYIQAPDSACHMIVYIRDKQTLCIDTMMITMLECCYINSIITLGGVPMISNTKLTTFIPIIPCMVLIFIWKHLAI
jgi:hypothetical protein